MLINKKDLIRINQEVGSNGRLVNESSLDYALNITKHRKSWLYELSYLVRSLLVDHVFEDGNKRTALALILVYFEEKHIRYDRNKVSFVVHKIAKKNINNVIRIMELIKSGIR